MLVRRSHLPREAYAHTASGRGESERVRRLGGGGDEWVLRRDPLEPPLRVHSPDGAAQFVVARDRGAQVADGVVAVAEQGGQGAEVAVDGAEADDSAAGGRGPAGEGEEAVDTLEPVR